MSLLASTIRLVRKAQPEKVLAEMSRFRGRVIRSSLSPEQESRLQAALSGPQVSMPGSSSEPAANGTAAGIGTSPAAYPVMRCPLAVARRPQAADRGSSLGPLIV
ncbi:hypothetical protein GCM10007888_28850 [Methylobacterium oxalidis]|uniref:Uncharacterized protein n=1 Tax=Methylobacterium oxalidis TaxID=944322 RepID=A0ABQ6DK58_9HYPH|nr:hypothetical protein GCM10007888_28850 [Methylobacterium oxalidis]